MVTALTEIIRYPRNQSKLSETESKTDPPVEPRKGPDCMVGLECFLDVVRALGMGSCLSLEGGSAYGPVPSSPGPGNKRRKRRVTGNSSATAVAPPSNNLEMWLHRIPGRQFLNGSSDFASLFCKQGKKGVNQDAMIAWENFGSPDTIFCGVFDGHGPFGHVVAKKVRDALPLKLTSQWVLTNNAKKGAANDTNEAASYQDHKDNEHCELFMTLKDSFLKAFKVMDKELKLHPRIDCYCSGTTAVTLVKQGQDLVIANVGDSRALLGTRDEDGSLVAVQLTVDLKPNLPRETERIMRFKGRVFALQNEPEVA
ncbi:unnamed protein product [Prunus armeniaca]